ncbi:MAG TPA: hypothetical protein VG713_06525 [Pirellulales bacterium]|nr:hypothetical protein [Pirellulales bacterium]
MKAKLAKFMPYKGVGLYVGDREVVVSKVAGTPLGMVELERHSQAFVAEELGSVIGQLLTKVCGARRHAYPIAVGVSSKRVFYCTRPIGAGKDSASAQTILREVMQSPNVRIDELSVQVVKGSYNKRNLVSIASCRSEYLLDLLQILQDNEVQPFFTEPAPLALLRAASQARRVRKSKPALRLFLGPTEGLAVVTAGSVCVFWRSFKLNPGIELRALGASVRSCQTLLGHYGIDVPLDVVLAHGREDLQAGLNSEQFAKTAGLPIVWCPAPELSGGSIAYGLALGCVGDPVGVVDLTKSMTPQPTIWQIFPWGELSVQVALVLCMALFLFGHAQHAEKAIVPVRAELAKRAWANNKPQADLVKEQRELTAKVEAVKKFAGTRILWTKYLQDVADRLPASATLTMLQGMAELDTGGKRPKKSFTMRAESAINESGVMPSEIDEFLASLRGDPLLKRDFPDIELTDIKTTQPSRKDEVAQAIFTVLCLPKTIAPAAKPPEAKAHK